MADYSCDFCSHENLCPYAFERLDCYVKTIKAARTVVDEEFKAFLAKLEEKNEDMDDDDIDVLIRTMKSIISDSEQPLPDWATQEETEQVL